MHVRVLAASGVVAWIAGSVIAACSGGTDSTAVPDGGVGSVDGEVLQEGSVGQVPTSPTDCTPDTLCFDVVPVRPGTPPLPGRLMVVWFQLDDDGPDPVPKIAYEVPFSGTETRVSIPISQITPPDEPNMLCQRACDDEATCPCLSDPKVGIGEVAVTVAPDGGGAGLGTAYGVAQMGVGYSATAFKPAPSFPDGGNYAYDRLFPDGIEQGVRGYALVRPEGGSFDRLGSAPPGTVFTLTVCDTLDTAVCRPKGPNLD